MKTLRVDRGGAGARSPGRSHATRFWPAGPKLAADAAADTKPVAWAMAAATAWVVVASATGHDALVPIAAVLSAGLITVLLLARSTPTVRLGAFSVAILAAKLVLTGQNEIVAVKYDAWAYVDSAGSGAPWARLETSPGYPIWLWLGMQTGIPQRVAIEILFGLSAVMLAAGVGWTLAGTLGYCAVFFCTVFSPASFHLFDQAWSDGFFACLSLAALGLVGWVIGRSAGRVPVRWLIALGVVVGTMQITRKESALIAAGMAMLFVALVACGRHERVGRVRRSWRECALRAGGWIAIIALSAAGVTLGNLAVHRYQQGVWVSSMPELPAHWGLLRRLARIAVTAPPVRMIPISREAMVLAFDHSPTLARLRPIIESPDNLFRIVSEEALGRPGEIGAGWIWHVFNAAAGTLGIRKARDLDAFYTKVNAELDAAFDRGSLRSRFVLHPLLGADPSIWLPYLPEGFEHVGRAIRNATPPQVDNAYQAQLFDRVLLRRAVMTPLDEGLLHGWAYASDGGRVDIEVGLDEVGQASAINARRTARPDLQTMAPGIPIDSGYAAQVPIAPREAYRLTFRVGDARLTVPASTSLDKVSTASLPGSATRLFYAVDRIPESSPHLVDGWRGAAMNGLLRIYAHPATWWVVAGAIVGALIVLGREAKREWPNRSQAFALVALIVGWIVARLVFYAVIDAAAWKLEPRYVQVAGIIAVALAAAAIALLVDRATVRVPRARTPDVSR